LTFAGRGADALALIDALDAAGTSRTLATWNRVLRMRVTQDWRVSLEPATLLEEGTLLGFSNAPSSAAGGTVTSGLFGVLLRWVGNFSSSVVSLVNNH